MSVRGRAFVNGQHHIDPALAPPPPFHYIRRVTELLMPGGYGSWGKDLCLPAKVHRRRQQ
jgi:hypothetical protein